jgi:single-strand DNA-binding protein
MKGINKAILVGIVGQDPTVKKVSEDFSVASFSLATTDSFKDKETNEWTDSTEWHNIVAYNKLSGVVDKIIHKGAAVYIEGKLKTKTYDKDGVKQYRTEIIAENISVIKKKEDGNNSSASTNDPDDDDLPF